MKVPAITIYQAIQYHIDKLCAFYDISRDLINLTLSSSTAFAITSIPEYAVHGLAGSVFRKGMDSGCEEHFGVGTVQVVPTVDDMFYVTAKFTPGFELFKTIYTSKELYMAELSTEVEVPTEVVLSKGAVDILNTMKEWETAEYNLFPETPFTNGFNYLQQYCDTKYRKDGKKWKLSVVDKIPEKTGQNQTDLLYTII